MNSTMTLYHFTDERNIESIKENGLISWHRLNVRKIVHYPASNQLSRELDVRKNLQDYVHLTFNRNNPMARRAEREGRIGKLVWLIIDEAACKGNPSALYSDMNATANSAVISDDPRTALASGDSQREILMRESIEAKWITFPIDYANVPVEELPW